MMEKNESPARSRNKSILLVCLIAAAVGIYGLMQFNKHLSTPGRPHSSMTGQPAPDFSLQTLDGEVLRLSDYKGKIVFLNIWATWCKPCREEMPAMENLYQSLKGKTFEMLAVSIDEKGAQVVAPFVKELRLTFPILLDKEGRIGNMYNTTGVPETFIIDKKGIIVYKIIGARDWADPNIIQTLTDLTQKPLDDN